MKWMICERGVPAKYVSDCGRFRVESEERSAESELGSPTHIRRRWFVWDSTGVVRGHTSKVLGGKTFRRTDVAFRAVRMAKLHAELELAPRSDR